MAWNATLNTGIFGTCGKEVYICHVYLPTKLLESQRWQTSSLGREETAK